jgi:hypothetical protein
MKPCDCKDIMTTKNKLNEQGMFINKDGIEVIPNSVFLTIGPVRVQIPMNHFRRFAEWYLEDQVKEDEE